jgi:hypothetical protein
LPVFILYSSYTDIILILYSSVGVGKCRTGSLVLHEEKKTSCVFIAGGKFKKYRENEEPSSLQIET